MRRALVVEDELSIANFIGDVLQMLGMECKNLTSGSKVIQTAKEWKPDLITLDLMMPSPDGLEILNRLKDDPDTSAIPVFVISVIAAKSDIADKISRADQIFSKPLDTKRFILEVQKVTAGWPA